MNFINSKSDMNLIWKFKLKKINPQFKAIIKINLKLSLYNKFYLFGIKTNAYKINHIKMYIVLDLK